MHDDRPPWMPFYWDAFFTDHKVELLTNEQLGIYLRLMRHAWAADPPASIPTGEVELKRITHCQNFEIVRPVLDCFSKRNGDRYFQKRMEVEYHKAAGKREAQRKAAEETNKNRNGRTLSATASATLTGRYARSNSSSSYLGNRGSGGKRDSAIGNCSKCGAEWVPDQKGGLKNFCTKHEGICTRCCPCEEK